MKISSALKCALDFVFPENCAVCGRWSGETGGALCGECLSLLYSEVTAASCSAAQTTNGYLRGCETVSAVGRYGGILADLIRKFKYGNTPRLAGVFGRLLFETYSRNPGLRAADLTTGVPLHFLRRFNRGYNQSELAARAFARLAGIDCARGVLARRSATRQQAKLSARERRENVAGVFRVPRRNSGVVAGRRIIIVDDVLTTGSTLNECAAALKSAGASEVHGLVIAAD